jgi:hypothetical protein
MTSDLLELGTFSKLLLPVLGGTLLAILLGPWPHPLASSTGWKTIMTLVGPIRRSFLAFGGSVERSNDVLCQWPAASISLLVLVLLLGTSMYTAI